MPAKIETQLRDKVGSRWARRLRMQGRIPASIQGEDRENLNVSIDEATFLAARRQHEHVFELVLDNGTTEPAMVRELQWVPLSEDIQHVEFRRVVLGQETEAEVELTFVGHPKGGMLNHLVTHVTIAAIPSKVPDHIEVKVDDLDTDHPLLAKDLEMPEGVRLVTDGDTQVAVAAAMKAEAPAEGEGEEGEEGAEAPA